MKILFIIENYYPHIGGVETVFKNLAEALVKKNHEVEIVTHRIKNTKEYEEIKGVKIHRVNCFYSRYLFTFFSIPEAFKLAKKADILHTTTFNGAFPAWLVSKLRKKSCVITVHEVWVGLWGELSEFSWLKRIIHNMLEKLIYFLPFDKYIAVSNFTRRRLVEIGISENKTEVVYNSLNYSLFDPKKYNKNKTRKEMGLSDEFVCFSYGRPGISKGFDYLTDAIPIIIKKIPDSKFVLMLSKDKAYRSQYDKLIEKINDLNIKNKIILLEPARENKIPAYLNAADCVIVPSLSEGFGYAVAEACAMDIPVVASDVASLPEIISGRFVLVKPKNPKEIAEGIIKVYNKKYKKTKLKKFLIKNNVEGYLKIYKTLLHN
jgi:glycosyltransferase involved in cell wall biosynthesis